VGDRERSGWEIDRDRGERSTKIEEGLRRDPRCTGKIELNVLSGVLTLD